MKHNFNTLFTNNKYMNLSKLTINKM